MNAQYNFILVSRKTGDAFKIRDEIERNRLYSVEMIETAPAALGRLAKGDISCMVFNFDSFNQQKISVITNLRDMGYTFPVIIFAAFVQKEAYDIVKKMDRVIIIECPFEAKDVWGICQKIVQGAKVNQRIFRRFYTNQKAVLEKTISGEIIAGAIYNLSHGGAYMELHSGRVRRGEILKVTIQLNKISKAYNVDAQVVWTTPQGFWLGKPAIGLKFMKAGDVYRNLLDKL
ncbi:MAG: PilZ domain-containing protein [Oligoflexia bacterium]|nr:PilZ domain-containing protein [Oligoflexia bacterium]